MTPTAYRVRARNLVPDSDNKIHDDDVARRFGFTGALVPGVEVFAYSTHPFVEAYGEDFLASGLIEIRFRRPIYDGDDVTVEVQTGDEFAITKPDGETAAIARFARTGGPVDTDGYREAPLPDDPPPADETSLRSGPLGTIVEVATKEGCEDYLDGIGETLPLYCGEGIVHPGLLARMVNASLFRNVALGPWIHTSTRCQFLAVARVGTTLRSYATVVKTYERNGNRYVDYDALIRADDDAVAQISHTAIYQLALSTR